jgi:L-aminopeptidase/D-esterase-like protein
MTNRIHSCLDGDTALDALTTAEREQVAQFVDTIERVVGEVGGGSVPELAARVMEEAFARARPQAREHALT